jgi:hypothetical protein
MDGQSNCIRCSVEWSCRWMVRVTVSGAQWSGERAWKCRQRTYFPNIVYLRSKWGWGAYVMKNWLALVFGPLFAIDTTPRTLCCKREILVSSVTVLTMLHNILDYSVHENQTGSKSTIDGTLQLQHSTWMPEKVRWRNGQIASHAIPSTKAQSQRVL